MDLRTNAGVGSSADLDQDTLMMGPSDLAEPPQPGPCPGTSADGAGLHGPSKAKSNANAPKPMFFPVIDHGRVPSAPISGSHDLLSLFNVSSMYDRFVKPYLKPPDPSPSALNGLSGPSGALNGDVKGKGKAELGGGGPGPETLGQKRMKMEKSYGHFVADVGGRNSIKKDHQLQSWITDPTIQETTMPNFLKPFESETLGKAFSLQAGTLPGFDTSVWIAEEGGPKRKRKKRKQGEMMAGNIDLQPPPIAHPPAPNGHIGPGALHPPQNHKAHIDGTVALGRPDSLNNAHHHHHHAHNHLNHHPHGLSQPPQNIQLREEEHRKKKQRTKMGSGSGPGSVGGAVGPGGPKGAGSSQQQQVALQL